MNQRNKIREQKLRNVNPEVRGNRSRPIRNPTQQRLNQSVHLSLNQKISQWRHPNSTPLGPVVSLSYDVLSLFLLTKLLVHVRSDVPSSEESCLKKNFRWYTAIQIGWSPRKPLCPLNEDNRAFRNYLQKRTWLNSNWLTWFRIGRKPKRQNSNPTPNTHNEQRTTVSTR